jgi:hypothetical protein
MRGMRRVFPVTANQRLAPHEAGPRPGRTGNGSALDGGWNKPMFSNGVLFGNKSMRHSVLKVLESAILCLMVPVGFRLSHFSRLVFLLLLFAGTSAANSIIWMVTGTFDDGGQLTGWVEFETSATTNVASDYSLIVSGGNTSVFPGFTFTPSNSASGGGFSLAELLVNGLSDGRELLAFFSHDLTDPSGTPNSLTTGAEFSPGATSFRSFSSGMATLGSAAPEPGTLVTMATALASLMVRICLRRDR